MQSSTPLMLAPGSAQDRAFFRADAPRRVGVSDPSSVEHVQLHVELGA
jgi:hypothetical protein